MRSKETKFTISKEKILNKQEDDLIKPLLYEKDFTDCDLLDLTVFQKEIFIKPLNMTEATGYEYVEYVYKNRKTIIRTSNEHGRVLLNDSLINENAVKLFHSHSSDSPFSLPDIKQLLFRQIVDEIGVVCKNKDVFLLSVGNGYLPEYEDFVRFVKDIKQDILNTVSQIEGFDKMSMVERQYMFIKERLFRIVREYGWTYKGGKLDGNE